MIAMRCKEHPQYRVRRRPLTECLQCWKMWAVEKEKEAAYYQGESSINMDKALTIGEANTKLREKVEALQAVIASYREAPVVNKYYPADDTKGD